ncbi:2OG-Fe(II) oxygenase [Marinomonas pollencensis]|uniref:Fe2OG dioxygenase domain-containing protein n=1 Tax=Marinomonas pollencensis TaxID=491954 RepID=A0A3E0DT25_9GAMM|nr:2OG-Fe(II) oxygenase [Marinomonas pollencensis]REG85646.1 hypothetical protein DFP81_102179 [Marinomonas pollencensis]
MSMNSLQLARSLELPSREAMLQRAPSVQMFWNNNKTLLEAAWAQWETSEQERLTKIDDSLLDSALRDAVTESWNDPLQETKVANLMHEIAPDVFQFQLFDPERLADLRHYLDAVADAEIPLRPPYGIALNRGGAMLDARSEGYLAAPSFQNLYQELLDKYMRPIARLLFPETMGYDGQTFGFSIQYQANTDTSLRLHTDASSVTLNVNLNLPGETFTGSEVDFYDSMSGKMNRYVFEPGVAVIHRGNVAHAAHPITSGKRTNFVLWLYGKHGQTPSFHVPQTLADAHQRWTTPDQTPDSMAPF